MIALIRSFRCCLMSVKRQTSQFNLRPQLQIFPNRKLGFTLETEQDTYSCISLVIATGGKSIPKMGATGFGYDIAKQFGLNIIETRPALVPLTFADGALAKLKNLSGISVNDAIVSYGKTKFQEALLFTHRGLSGPSILQIVILLA